MSSFSDYYQKYRNKYGTSVEPYKPSVESSNVDITEDEPQGFLGWVTDIISRPEFAVTNAWVHQSDATSKAVQDYAEGDPWAAIGDYIGGVAGTPYQMLRGFFSTDEKDKHYGSDVIQNASEDSIDALAALKAADSPNIDADELAKKAKDNLHQDGDNAAWNVFKGVAGLGIDFAADPLTYTPAGVISEVGKSSFRGARIASNAAHLSKASEKASAKASKAATEAVAQASDGGSKSLSKRLTKKANKYDNLSSEYENIENAVDGLSVPSALLKGAEVGLKSWRSGRDASTAARLAQKAAGKEAKLATKAAETSGEGFASSAAKIAENKRVHDLLDSNLSKSSLASKLAVDSLKKPTGALKKAMDDVGPAVESALLKESADSLPDSLLSFERATSNEVSKAIKSPEAQKLNDLLSHLSKGESNSFSAAVSSTFSSDPLTKQEWLEEAATKAESLSSSKTPLVNVGEGMTRRLSSVIKDFRRGDAAAKKKASIDLTNYYNNSYLPKFTKESSRGRLVDALGKEVPVTDPLSGGAVETVGSALDRFNDLVQNNETIVRDYLGDKLTDSLKKFNNSTNFDNVINKLSGILTDAISPNAINKTLKSAPSRNLLNKIGVDTEGLKNSVRPAASKTKSREVFELGTSKDTRVTEALSGGKTDDPNRLNRAQGFAKEGLKKAHAREVVEPKEPSLYAYESATGTKRTEKVLGEGVGRNEREWNTYSQYTTYKGIRQSILKSGGYKNSNGKYLVSGPAYANKYKFDLLPALRVAERALDELGVVSYIGVGEARKPMYLSQIFDIVNNTDSHAANLYFFNGGTMVPETNLMEAVSTILAGGSRDDVVEALSRFKNKYETGGFDNNLARIDSTGARMDKLGRYGNKEYRGEDLVNGLADTLMAQGQRFADTVSENAKRWGFRIENETKDISDEVLSDINSTFNNADSLNALILSISNAGQRVKRVAARDSDTQAATNLSGIIVGSKIPEFEFNMAVTFKRQAEKYAKSKGSLPRDARLKANKEFTDTMSNEVDKTLREFDDSGEVRVLKGDTSQRLDGQLFGRIRALDDPEMGNKELHDILVRNKTVTQGAQASVRKGLNNLQKGLLVNDADRSIAREAYQRIQQGVHHTGGRYDLVDEVADEFRPIIRNLFGSGRDDDVYLMSNFFINNGTSIDHANQVMSRYGLERYIFDTAKAEEKAAEEGMSLGEALGRQWMDAERLPDDPVEFLSKMFTSFSDVSLHQTIANDMMRFAERRGATSSVPKKGFVRFKASPGETILGEYLPKDIYIHDYLARQADVIDSMMKQSLSKSRDNDFWHFIDGYWLPILDMWKVGMTIVNPRHHFRNLYGDLFLTYNANGAKNYWSSQKDAYGIMQNYRKDYDFTDAMMDVHAGGSRVKGGTSTVVKGSLAKNGITAEEFYKIVKNHGNLPNFRTIELLETDLAESTILARKWKNISNSKFISSVGTVSELRDHYVRLAHFLQFVRNNIDNTRRFNSLDGLLEEASKQTRKWHPDGRDLGTFGQYAKLVIPFYSWTRQAAPRILETALVHPERFNMPNKVSYNIAVASGVNPDSLSNPFPDDQLFPSYMTRESHGPQFKIGGHYYGGSPGIPQWDIPEQLFVGSDNLPMTVTKNILGMSSPLITVAPEMVTGTHLATGGKIHDWSDWLDSQIPLVSPVGRISGYSPTGSVTHLLSGDGLDPTYQESEGSANPQLLSLVNYLFGVSGSDMSRPNQIGFAAYEKAKRAGETDEIPF